MLADEPDERWPCLAYCQSHTLRGGQRRDGGRNLMVNQTWYEFTHFQPLPFSGSRNYSGDSVRPFIPSSLRRSRHLERTFDLKGSHSFSHYPPKKVVVFAELPGIF